MVQAISWILLLTISMGPDSPKAPESVEDLMALTPQQLDQVDIIRMNLVLARELGEKINISTYTQKVDKIAQHIKLNIEASEPFFEQNKEMFEGSREKWICVMIWQVLAEDFNIHYLKEKSEGLDHSQAWQKFVHGLLDKQQGTCCTMPVLYLAIGQRLGYPIKGVETTTHMFCRWEGKEDSKFNIETTSDRGMTFPSDETIAQWSKCPQEYIDRGLLKTMNSRQLLAHFLLLRSDSHIALEKWDLAQSDLQRALKCYPGNPVMAGNLQLVNKHLIEEQKAPPVAQPQPQE